MADKVIFETGSENGSLVTLDAKVGNQGGGQEATRAAYSSPLMATDGKGEILVFNGYGLVSHDLSDGTVLKKYQHKTRFGVNAAQPIDLGSSVLIFQRLWQRFGFGRLCEVPSRLWESSSFSCQMASLVRLGDYAYGIEGQSGARVDKASCFARRSKKGKKRWGKRGV